MSKMDGLRAMREARYEQATARATKPAVQPKPQQRATPRPAEGQASPAAEEPSVGEACGHRNMSGRTCTRDKGHAAKSHRYS